MLKMFMLVRCSTPGTPSLARMPSIGGINAEAPVPIIAFLNLMFRSPWSFELTFIVLAPVNSGRIQAHRRCERVMLDAVTTRQIQCVFGYNLDARVCVYCASISNGSKEHLKIVYKPIYPPEWGKEGVRGAREKGAEEAARCAQMEHGWA